MPERRLEQMRFLGLTPYLYYNDAGAASDWLSATFGFEEIERYADEDGKVTNVTMRVGKPSSGSMARGAIQVRAIVLVRGRWSGSTTCRVCTGASAMRASNAPNQWIVRGESARFRFATPKG
jgi:hypothetical protein